MDVFRNAKYALIVFNARANVIMLVSLLVVDKRLARVVVWVIGIDRALV